MANHKAPTLRLRSLQIQAPVLGIIRQPAADQERQGSESAKARPGPASAPEIPQALAQAAPVEMARDAAPPEKAQAQPPAAEQVPAQAAEAARERELLRESQFKAEKAAQMTLPPTRSRRKLPMA